MSSEKPLAVPETLLVQHSDGEIEEMPLDEYLKGVVPKGITMGDIYRRFS